MQKMSKVAEVHLIRSNGIRREGRPFSAEDLVPTITMALSDFSSLHQGHHFDFKHADGSWEQCKILWTYDRFSDNSLAIYAVKA